MRSYESPLSRCGADAREEDFSRMSFAIFVSFEVFVVVS
jgi:hypothetical protein